MKTPLAVLLMAVFVQANCPLKVPQTKCTSIMSSGEELQLSYVPGEPLRFNIEFKADCNGLNSFLANYAQDLHVCDLSEMIVYKQTHYSPHKSGSLKSLEINGNQVALEFTPSHTQTDELELELTFPIVDTCYKLEGENCNALSNCVQDCTDLSLKQTLEMTSEVVNVRMHQAQGLSASGTAILFFALAASAIGILLVLFVVAFVLNKRKNEKPPLIPPLKTVNWYDAVEYSNNLPSSDD